MCGLTVFLPRLSQADWVNLTGAENAPNIAEIYIEDDRIRVLLEIFVEDIDQFQPLTATGFTAIRFTTAAGKQLPLSEIPLLERRIRKDRYSPYKDLNVAIPGAIITRPPEDPRVYYAELVFKLPEKPTVIQITPPVRDDGIAAVNIGFVLYHKNIPVTDFRYLSTTETLHLNWADPWYTAFENPNLSRHHQSPLTSYLYIEPYQVRHEILIRPKDLSAWMDLELSDQKYIYPQELNPLLKRIGEFLLTRNPVFIDGSPAKPILEQTEYVSVTQYGIQTIYPTGPLELNTALIGITISYLSSGVPNQVEMHWDMFNQSIPTVPSTTLDPAGPFIAYLSKEDNILTWRNYIKDFTIPEINQVEFKGNNRYQVSILLATAVILLTIMFLIYRRFRLPLWQLSLVILAASSIFFIARAQLPGLPLRTAALSPSESSFVVETLLKNIYRAFLLNDETDVYDQLALTVDGKLLESVFLKQRRSFQIKDAGGATAKVNSVNLVDIEAKQAGADNAPFTYLIRWTVEGTVTHWGHSHNRQNLYEGELTLKVEDNSWKITAMKTINEKRLAALTLPGKPLAG